MWLTSNYPLPSGSFIKIASDDSCSSLASLTNCGCSFNCHNNILYRTLSAEFIFIARQIIINHLSPILNFKCFFVMCLGAYMSLSLL